MKKEGKLFLILSLIIIILIMPVVFAEQIIIQPDENSAKDGYIRKDDPTKCFGTGKNLDSGQFWHNSAHRALLQFDLSTVPAGADIVSAELVLWMYNDGPGKDVRLNLHRITRNWQEGTTGYNDNGATWNKYDGVNNWNNQGGDYDNNIESSIIVNLQNQYYSWDVTNLIKNWNNGVYPNYGILLKGEDESSDIQMRKRFRSSKYGTVSQRPKLIINYNLEPVCTDSDNGLDYFNLGETCFDGNCETDYCTGNELTEFYCGNGIEGVSYVCEDGCLLGACIIPCVPKTCEELGKQCGTWEDGCGNQLDCGECGEGENCNLGVCQADVGIPSWHIQYNPTPINPAPDVQYWNLDLFDVPAETMQDLKNNGVFVMCYFSAGSWEDWRPDQAEFPESCKGNNNGWPGEKWIDTNCVEVRNIMKARIDLGVEKGCDGFDPDNMDAYGNNNGLGLTQQDAIDYYNFLADYAHAQGKQIGLKNALEIIYDVLVNMDWAVNEECYQWNECSLLNQVISDGKPVFQIEYGGQSKADQICPLSNAAGFSSLIKNLELDEFEISCLDYEIPEPPDYIAYDGFESNTWDGGVGWLYEWYHQGDASLRSNDQPYEGNRHLRLRRRSGYVDRAVDLSGYTSTKLGFYAKVKSFEKNDFAEVLVSGDGNNWDVLRIFTPSDSDNQYHYYEYDLSAYVGGVAYIAIDAEMSGSGDYLYIDEIKVSE